MSGHHSSRRRFLGAVGTTASVAMAGCLDTLGNEDEAETPAAEAFDAVVDPSWLTDHHDEVALLDVRSDEEMSAGHIEGAGRLSETIHSTYRDTDDGPETELDVLADALGAAGVERDDDVVVYGEETTMWATHGVYTLEAIGHEGSVFLLDGGFDAWEGTDGAVTTGDPEPVEASYETPNLERRVLATRGDVAERVDEDGASVTLVDNRGPAEYTGEDEDDNHERHGHITGAINLHFPQNVANGRLRSLEDLEALWLEEADLDPGAETISYCTTGVRGSVGWFVMSQLGWDDVSVYDGSWNDWGVLSADDGYYYTSGSGTIVDRFS